MSQEKLFTFNASSFSLNPSVQSFLKSKGAISLDFGTTAYINSEAMPAILSELVDKSTNADLVVQLKAEAGRRIAENQKMMEENVRLTSQVAALNEQAAGAAKIIEALKAENMRLQAALKNIPLQPAQGDDKLKQSYEKLQHELNQLRAQSAESLASLKILEDENEELMHELELLKNQSKTAAAPKVG